MHSNLRYLRVIFSQVAIITDKEIKGRISEYPDSKNRFNLQIILLIKRLMCFY